MQTQLPQGWRRVVSEDGRIYYQNDNTQATSWNIPTQPTEGENNIIQETTLNTPTQPTQDPNDITQQTSTNTTTQPTKDINIPPEALEIVSELTEHISNCINAWIKGRLIILFVTFIISVNNILSKILLVAALYDLSGSRFCSEFKCSTNDFIAQELKGDVGFLLFFFVIGFIADLAFICLNATHLYRVYRYPENIFWHCVDDVLNHVTELKWGWVPLLLQDLVLITATHSLNVNGVTTNVRGIFGMYLYAIVSSLINLTKSVLLTSRTHYEFSKVDIYSGVRGCHCCWGTTLVIILFPMAIWIIHAHDPSPWVDIYSENYGANYNCSMYSNHTNSVFGDIIKTADLVYADCGGSDYDYLLNCYSDSDKHIDKLNCYLYWEYSGYLDDNSSNETRCDNSDDDYCLFYVDLGICSNYTINCANSFSFVDGDPQIWVCFDYCEI